MIEIERVYVRVNDETVIELSGGIKFVVGPEIEGHQTFQIQKTGAHRANVLESGHIPLSDLTLHEVEFSQQ